MHLVFVDLIFLLDICLVLQSYSEVRGFIEIAAVVSSQCRSDSVFLSYAKLLVDRLICTGLLIFAAFESFYGERCSRMFSLCRRFCGVSFYEEILGNGTKVGTSPFPLFVSVGGEVCREIDMPNLQTASMYQQLHVCGKIVSPRKAVSLFFWSVFDH
uniref:Putative secreted protein n=1 Tax=Ixodes scapularis TaxID=6945 RepID=A0A4D5RDQ2_IXOSC